MRWLIGCAAAVVLVGAVTACGGEATPPVADEDEHHHHGDGTVAEGSGEFDIGLGGPVSLSGDFDAISYEVTYAVTGVTVVETDDAGEPAAENDVLLVAEVEITGFRGDHEAGPGNTDFVFSLLDAEGREYPRSDQVVAPELVGTVEADQTLTGRVVFDVPESAAESGSVRLAAEANGSDLLIDWEY
ncbi:hypothetical protein LX16_1365 [Stackebrandtia albiflava]|uniref:DUF4352 domain-containing protein n=1 Tax=Stackebrandtia albiflava TaxID=406432 RepID=A0A562VCP6_9ACTN|nr:DUF4352 domain-containing protein [Stackebrandtia albiflava]TWJ15654.1 hypothetical protein LX16_1365 [Stackebrandtia albiflava]